MSGYLGNPKFVMMAQDSIPIANFEYPVDPVVTVNPVRVPVSWLNTVTGVIWVCTDNTTDANVWESQRPVFRGALLNKIVGGADQSIANTTWTAITFNTVIYDTDSFSDIGTDPTILTVPAGVSKIRMSGSASIEGTTSGFRYVQVRKNGVAFVGTATLTPPLLSGTIFGYCVSPPIDVTEGDTLSLWIYQASGSARAVYNSDQTWLAIEVIE